MKLFAALALVFLPSVASADIPPPNSRQCKAASGACTLDEGGDGHCEAQTCSRATRDGGVDYACTICVAGAPAAEPGTTTKKSNCDAGGADSLLAMGAVAALIARRRIS